MKNINQIITLILIHLAIFSYAGVYTIGNDTIHKIDGYYYYIGITDTTLADTSVITVNFYEDVLSTTIDSIEQIYSFTTINQLSDSSFQYGYNSGINYVTFVNSLNNETVIKSIGCHCFMQLASVETPDDTYFDEQWYLEKLQVYNKTSDNFAWNLTRGSNDIIVAVIDAGLEWEYEEFAADDYNIDVVANNEPENDWMYLDNPETGNDIDDDENGYIDDYKGWDFNNIIYTPGSGNADTEDNDVRPTHSSVNHGNAIAGIIGAKTNNSNDIAGMAGGDASNLEEGVKIMPLKVLDLWYQSAPFPTGYVENLPTCKVERAIYYAVNNHANIINMSFGCTQNPKEPLEAAIQYAIDNNVTLVASAGNDNYTNLVSYPARIDNVIAVGASDKNDEQWNDSNSGDEIEISAPGEDIVILGKDGEVGSGTSFSSAMVSATVAMMLSVNPYLSNGDINEEGSIRYILKETNDKVGGSYTNGWNKRMGYGRLNTYNAVCKALEYKPEIIVEDNETWTNDVFSTKNIIIKSGTQLTISGKVMMGEDAQIIVEQGATLTVDGGHITNIPYCSCENQFWGGIEVWGYSDKPQESYTNNPTEQGQLILNNALIENATVAVRLFSKKDILNTTGGIVLAENSVFKNNKRCASFFPFKNIIDVDGINYGEFDYFSKFKNCSFVIDEDFNSGNYGWSEMICLWGVKGVKFQGCSFENNFDLYPTNIAISSYNAGFKIKGICQDEFLPCQNYIRSSFKGFYRAIEAGNASNALYTIHITETDFEHNGYGLLLTAVNDAVIVGNNFELGEHDECQDDGSYGIFLDNCKRFAIEENNFYLHNPVYAAHNTGIRVLNTNNPSDELYNNTFDGMEFAVYTDYKNYSPDENKGLAFYCNGNQNNYIDFYVSDKGNDKGIQKLQGEKDYPAGNTFSPAAIGHFYNYGDFELEYYYNPYSLNQTPTELYRVKSMPINIANTCPSHYNGSNTRLSTTDFQQIASVFSSATSLYDSYRTQYDSIGQNGDSATLALLENLMAYNYRELSNAAYDIMRSNLNDSIVKANEFVTWLNNISSYASDESLSDYYMQKGDTVNALNMIDSLWANYNLSSDDSTELVYFSQLKTTQSKLINTGRNIFGLTSLEKSKIMDIAENSHGIAGAQARSILSFAYDNYTIHPECTDNPEEIIKSARASGNGNDNPSAGKFINIYPNPVSGNATIEYLLPESAETGNLEIYDETGRKITEYYFDNENGSIIINTNTYNPGIYVYKFVSGDTKETGRLIILK